MTKRARVPERVLALLAGVLVLLVLVESGLRIGGASFEPVGGTEPSAASGEASTVLCLGESTTAWGGEYAYPRQLGRVLQQGAVGPYRVVNAGEPGRDSRSIVANLEGNLERFQPWVVVAMMGANDVQGSGAIPEGFGAPSGERGLLGGLRTLRLIRLLWHQREHPWASGPRGGPAHGEEHIENTPAVLAIDRVKQAQAEGREAEGREALVAAVEGCLEGRLTYPEIAMGIVGSAPLAIWLIEEIEDRHVSWADSRVGLQLLGVARLSLGQEREAEQAILQALELEPLGHWAAETDQAPLRVLVRLLYQQGREEELRGWLVRYADAVPGDGHLHSAASGLYERDGRHGRALALREHAASIRAGQPSPLTRESYLALGDALAARGIHLVAVGYPRRDIAGLEALVEGIPGVTLVDNQDVFEQAVAEHGYDTIFADRCYGDFGHGTPEGNRLLAEQVAGAIAELPPPDLP